MQLIQQDQQLTLTNGNLSIAVDFASAQSQYRRKQGEKELLIKAVTSKGHQHPTLIDATAGLGRDAFVLASHGCQTTMLERCDELVALLQDGLTRARAHAELLPIIARMSLIHTDSITYLTSLTPENHPEVIYIDPMFPSRKKSALVKKDMQLLQQLITQEDDGSALLEIALTRASKRVVVKRPRKASSLGGLKPSFALPGSACRFDVYCNSRSITI